MSIQSEIDRVNNNVAETYSNLEDLGADMPQTRNSNNLPETVKSIKAVRYDEQNLTDEQKAKARTNIGAVGKDLFANQSGVVEVTSGEPTHEETVLTIDPEAEEIHVYTAEEVDEKVSKLSQEIVDHKTEVDDHLDGMKVDIVQEVLSQIKGESGSVFGKVNADGTITITTDLAEGEYTIMYENEDGTLAEIGTIKVGEDKVVVVNLVPTSLDLDGDGIYNGIGYKNGAYPSMSSAGTPSTDGSDSTTVATGIIPFVYEDGSNNCTFYIKGVTLDTSKSHVRCHMINADFKTMVQVSGTSWPGVFTIEELGDMYYKLTPISKDITRAYIRFSFVGTGDNLFIATTPIE